MRRIINKGLLAVLLVLLPVFVGCTVKEDRVPCPCYLNVSFTHREAISHPVTLIGWDANEVFRETINVAEHDPYWVRAVQKGTLTLAACMGASTSRLLGHQVTIPSGSQADSLYAYHMDVDCTGEMAYAEVTLRKQFATVRVDLLQTAAQMREFKFNVEGTSCGFDLLDYSAVEGAFRFSPVATGRTVDFRIPRQADDALTLEIIHQGERLGLFPLGKYILRTGYDWNAEELQDIFITIDLVLGQVIVRVADWQEGVVFKLIEQ